MMRLFKIFSPIFLIFLISCATPYQKSGFTGGYTDYQMSEDVFKVKFRGNVLVDLDTTKRYALVRAAEITIEQGGFMFVPGAIDKTVEEFTNFYDDGYSFTFSSYNKPKTEIEFTIFSYQDLRDLTDITASDAEILETMKEIIKLEPNSAYIAEDVIRYMKP